MLPLGFSAQPHNQCACSWLPALQAQPARRRWFPPCLRTTPGRQRANQPREGSMVALTSLEPKKGSTVAFTSPLPRLQNRFQPRSSHLPPRLQPCRQHLAQASSPASGLAWSPASIPSSQELLVSLLLSPALFAEHLCHRRRHGCRYRPPPLHRSTASSRTQENARARYLRAGSLSPGILCSRGTTPRVYHACKQPCLPSERPRNS